MFEGQVKVVIVDDDDLKILEAKKIAEMVFPRVRVDWVIVRDGDGRSTGQIADEVADWQPNILIIDNDLGQFGGALRRGFEVCRHLHDRHSQLMIDGLVIVVYSFAWEIDPIQREYRRWGAQYGAPWDDELRVVLEQIRDQL